MIYVAFVTILELLSLVIIMRIVERVIDGMSIMMKWSMKYLKRSFEVRMPICCFIGGERVVILMELGIRMINKKGIVL
jgi:hypothetical protein